MTASGKCVWPRHPPTIQFSLALIASLALLALFFWQVFVTMPHLVRFYGDTGGYLDAGPLRGIGLYSFMKFALLFWNDFYAVAVAQDLLLALNAALLAYALWRVTRSAFLMLAPLVVCLFRPFIIEHAQGLSTDALFPIVCIGMMACALLIYEKVSPWRIGAFLLLGFIACFLRAIGEVILWSLVLVLALRLWPARRRALAVLAAGCLSIHVAITGISYVNYGIWVPQAQAGQVLIIESAFIADENVSPSAVAGYPHDFAAATAAMRAEYNKALTWPEKYEVVDRYAGAPIQDLAIDTIVRNRNYPFDRDRYDKFDKYGPYVARAVMVNEVLQHAALTIIRQNPREYLQMVWVNLIAGVHMLTSYPDYPLEAAYNQVRAEHIAGIARRYMSGSLSPELLPLTERLIDDWHNKPLELKRDIARPIRAFFGLGPILSNRFTRSPLLTPDTPGGTLNWLFVIESAVVLLFATGRLFRRKPLGDTLWTLVLLIVPTWVYVFVLCSMVRPYGVYMEATTSFVYLALLIGAWTVVMMGVNRFWGVVPGQFADAKLAKEHGGSAAA